jgi:murein DD-endopeptidase MepM/ murein hydrolase activator NlpD
MRPLRHVLVRCCALAALALLHGCAVFHGAPDPYAAPRGRRSPPAPAAEHRHSGPPPVAVSSLVIPVQGIRAEQLRDSYEDGREGHVHHAIDIMAPGGTPVVAAADGAVLKLRTGGIGGITVYQVGPDGRTLFYYAHLLRYVAGLAEGQTVKRGQIIAYVGDTGNAGKGNYHLHFSIGYLADPRRWWESENVNPYPLLAGDYARARVASGDR